MQVRLDKSEMPYSPPAAVIQAVKKSIESINRYTPKSKVSQLYKLLSEYANVAPESLILSFGSDILIKEFIYLFSKERQIIVADPTFFLITTTAQKTQSPLYRIKLKEPNFELSLETFIDGLKKPTLIIIDNPNNPTGNLLLGESNIKLLLENENVILLIDEAYYEFSKVGYAHLISEYPNLAVLRTLSKSFGLAGSGIGYLIAGETILNRFSGLDVMLPYPSVIAGIEALQNKDYALKYIDDVAKEKERITRSLRKMNINAYPSYTNFLLIKTDVPDLAQKLEQEGVFVSNLSNYSLSSDFIRVSIGSEIENGLFIEKLKEMIDSK
jgi:histidinol-phosphate aminotransferase